MIQAVEGIGQDGRLHSTYFFDLADQPVYVQMAVTTEESYRLFARLKAEAIRLFYVKIQAEFGLLGK